MLKVYSIVAALALRAVTTSAAATLRNRPIDVIENPPVLVPGWAAKLYSGITAVAYLLRGTATL
jgi:hypothetical protein